MSTATLLVIDDEPAICQLVRRKFESEGLHVITASNSQQGLASIAQHTPDVVLLDLVLPDGNGLDVFRELQAADAKLPVILITASGDSDTAIEAVKLGALDYLTKPLDFHELRPLVERALEIRRFMQEPVAVSQTTVATSLEGDVLIGRNRTMQAVYKAIGRVAPRNVSVLIRGESGTGKELVARALYHHSERSNAPFLEVNSAAIPEALLESELFGHEKGAFTGAGHKRIGKFEQCNGGTLFLDEIGDMPPMLQAKMLRVLQDQRFERVGGNETITTDVRVITATHRNLEEMVEEGMFRVDLFYRLNGFTISLPPLRERGDDLLLLIDYFLARANRELGKQIRGVSPKALDLLQQYTWPGNVRELGSALRQAVLQTSGPVLIADFLPESVRQQRDNETPPILEAPSYWDGFVRNELNLGTEGVYDNALACMESEVITRILRHTGGNQAEAARILGLTRTTLRTKIRQHNIVIDRVVHQDE